MRAHGPLPSTAPSRARRSGKRAGIFLAASVAAIAAIAAAEPRPITLRWTAPPGCPGEAALSARIDRLLGGPPASTDRRLDAAGVVEATPQGFRLEVTLSSGASGTESTRILQGATCEAVTDAGALVIALAFDPDAVAAQELKRAESDAGAPSGPDAAPADPSGAPLPAPTEPIRIPVPLPPASSTEASPDPAPPPSAPASRPSFSVLAALLGDAGALTDAAAGFRAGLSLGLGAYHVVASFEAFPSSRRALPDRPDKGAEMRLFAGALSGCRRVFPWTRAEPPPPGIAGSELLACVGAELGEMRGAGFGITAPGSAGVLWAAPRAMLRADVAIESWLAITVDLGIAVPLDRRRFVLDLSEGRAIVHEPSPVAGRAGLGLALRF